MPKKYVVYRDGVLWTIELGPAPAPSGLLWQALREGRGPSLCTGRNPTDVLRRLSVAGLMATANLPARIRDWGVVDGP